MSAELPEEIKPDVAFANGLSHPELGEKVAGLLGLQPVGMDLREHADTEIYARYLESIRGATLIAFETHAAVNGLSIPHAFQRHVAMIDAAVGAEAGKIIAVAPYVSGQLQDREAKEREAVTANNNLRQLRRTGASHLVTVDVHEGHTLLEFRRPGYGSSGLTARDILRERIGELMVSNGDDYVMVSPDEGHSKQIRGNAAALGISLVDMVKERDPDDTQSVSHFGDFGAVAGKTAVIMDDQINTAGTIASAAQNLREEGANAVIVAATHGIFSGPALSRLADESVDHVIVTDTVPTQKAKDKLGSKLEVLSVSGLISNALNRVIMQGSVSSLEGGNARL